MNLNGGLGMTKADWAQLRRSLKYTGFVRVDGLGITSRDGNDSRVIGPPRISSPCYVCESGQIAFFLPAPEPDPPKYRRFELRATEEVPPQLPEEGEIWLGLDCHKRRLCLEGYDLDRTFDFPVIPTWHLNYPEVLARIDDPEWNPRP